MNVLVLTNMAPFIWGGAEELTRHLVRNLLLRGAKAEAMRIPFSWNPYERLLEEMFICKSIKLANVDRVIALKFPAYLVPFNNKICWLLHQYRQAYELWETGHTNIPDTKKGHAVRAAIMKADSEALSDAKKVFAVSGPPRDRLLKYNGINAEVLLAPLNDPERFNSVGDDGYILATGRINAAKRQWMLLDAMRTMPKTAKLIVAGPPDSASDAEDLIARVERYRLQDRVRLDLRFLTREELADLVGRSRAVAYIPFEEDSMGYVCMEAYQASKPVVTLSDSGGLLQIVRHEDTGLIAEPNEESLADSMARLVCDPTEARRLGRAGHERWNSLGVTWPKTIDRLLG